jgi:predicted nucleic acid-binding protein
MTPAVIDASVVLRWAFDDEADRAGAVAVADALQGGRLRVSAPPHFLLEVAASLVVALRAGRIDRLASETIMGALAAVGIEQGDPHAFADAAMRLALATGIRVPDAAYLETARRDDALLISADREQLDAARRLDIACLSLSELPPL